MKRWLRDGGLSLVLLVCFLALLAGKRVAGLAEYNDERAHRALPALSYGASLAWRRSA